MNVYLIEDSKGDQEKIIEILSSRYPNIRSFDTGAEFLDVCNKLQVGVAIVDICLPDLDGLVLQRRLKRDCTAQHRIILVAGSCDVSDAVAAMRQGAIDVLEKPLRRAELLDAVTRAELDLQDELHRRSVEKGERRAFSGLTQRELDVLRASAHGESSKQVAFALYLSTRTVEMHRSHIIKKLGVPNFAAALVLLASSSHSDA